MWKRTGKTQTETTSTGVITTAEERHTKTRATRWVAIGYASFVKSYDSDKQKEVTVIDGAYGSKLDTRKQFDDNIEQTLAAAFKSNRYSLRRPDTAGHSFIHRRKANKK